MKDYTLYKMADQHANEKEHSCLYIYIYAPLFRIKILDVHLFSYHIYFHIIYNNNIALIFGYSWASNILIH